MTQPELRAFIKGIITGLAIGLLVLIVSVSAHAQDRGAKQFKIATAVFVGGALADDLSSAGRFESNPLFRNGAGKFSFPKAIAFDAANYGLALWLKKKHHSKLASAILLISGTAHGTAAALNVIRR